jgi:hypothetical protein
MTLNPDMPEGPANIDGPIGKRGFVGDAPALPAPGGRSISTAKNLSGLGWREFFQRLGDGSLPSRNSPAAV